MYYYHNIISSDVYRLQSQLHPQSGLELSIHSAQIVHSNNSLLHDLFFHVIRSLGSNIYGSMAADKVEKTAYQSTGYKGGGRRGKKSEVNSKIGVGGGGGSQVFFYLLTDKI